MLGSHINGKLSHIIKFHTITDAPGKDHFPGELFTVYHPFIAWLIVNIYIKFCCAFILHQIGHKFSRYHGTLVAKEYKGIGGSACTLFF